MPEHTPIVDVLGLDDETPIMQIVSTCSCGALVTDRRIDLSEHRPEPAEVEKWAALDAAAFRAHVEEAHGGEA